MSYDRENIFAKILRGEIPCDKVYEDAHVLAFNDINPRRPVHVLVIPKGNYVCHDDFAAHASDAEIAGFTRAVAAIARQRGIDESGYRLIVNTGDHGGQEVPHYHVHIIGGAPVGAMVSD
ncbi:MAG: histidine triad nucleotide-binding protein [Alphaproteobacteria bacterium]|nr:MAG: histidine triad nucleotide-binding protein [Alphaproteobacteria bacterium]